LGMLRNNLQPWGQDAITNTCRELPKCEPWTWLSLEPKIQARIYLIRLKMNRQCKALSRASFSLRSSHMWFPNRFGHWFVGTETNISSWKYIAHAGVGRKFPSQIFQRGIQHAPSKLHIYFPMCCHSGAPRQKSSFLLRLSRTGRLSFGLTVGGIKTCIPQGGLASDFSRPFSLAFWQVRSGQRRVVCLTPVWSVPASCSMMLSHPLDS
jgi:hypothetical protein